MTLGCRTWDSSARWDPRSCGLGRFIRSIGRSWIWALSWQFAIRVPHSCKRRVSPLMMTMKNYELFAFLLRDFHLQLLKIRIHIYNCDCWKTDIRIIINIGNYLWKLDTFQILQVQCILTPIVIRITDR